MSKYEGCGLAYINGYETDYMDEDIEDNDDDNLLNDEDCWDDEIVYDDEWPEEEYD